MKHGSLFSGIGGFDLAAEWMGWENVFHCEWNEFGQKILKYYWPNAISYGDINKTDFAIHRGGIDVLTGGFPCQPFSLAGKRKGTADDRHLWPRMLEVIREVQPGWVVGENVYGIVNWDGGLVFEQVQSDLESAGYEVQPVILPACAVNAPHRRDRVWFVAHSNSNGCERSNCEYEVNTDERGVDALDDIKSDDVANASNQGLQRGEDSRDSGGIRQERNKQFAGLLRTDWQDFPTQSPLCSRDDEFSSKLDGITLPKWRNESIKAYGNAIVPQVVFEIFKAIEQYEQSY